MKDGDREILVNWLADENMLPAKLPDSRIMTFNYESQWLLSAPKQRRSLCAEQLLTALDNKRKKVIFRSNHRMFAQIFKMWQEEDTKYRPLIFIGHSFGGVVIEQVRKDHPPKQHKYLPSVEFGKRKLSRR